MKRCHFIYRSDDIVPFIRNLLASEKQKYVEETKKLKYRKVKGGMKQKGEIGTASNLDYCYGYNSGIDEAIAILEDSTQ